jgi:hypothetical protein
MFITEMKREFDNLKFIEAVHLDPGIDTCKQRIRERRNHPTLGRTASLRYLPLKTFNPLFYSRERRRGDRSTPS